jgi:hypothetical protein
MFPLFKGARGIVTDESNVGIIYMQLHYLRATLISNNANANATSDLTSVSEINSKKSQKTLDTTKTTM